MAIPLALPLVGGAAAASATLATGAAVQVANQIQRFSRPPTPPSGPPDRWDPALTAMMASEAMRGITDHGARIASDLLQELGPSVRSLLQNVWSWLNAPAVPGTAGPDPNITLGDIYNITISPRSGTHRWEVNRIGYVPPSFGLPSFPPSYHTGTTSLARPSQTMRLRQTTAASDPVTGSNGQTYRVATYAIERINSDTLAIIDATTSFVAAVGTVSVSIRPTEADTAGWTSTTNVIAPPNRTRRLPANSESSQIVRYTPADQLPEWWRLSLPAPIGVSAQPVPAPPSVDTSPLPQFQPVPGAPSPLAPYWSPPPAPSQSIPQPGGSVVGPAPIGTPAPARVDPLIRPIWFPGGRPATGPSGIPYPLPTPTGDPDAPPTYVPGGSPPRPQTATGLPSGSPVGDPLRVPIWAPVRDPATTPGTTPYPQPTPTGDPDASPTYVPGGSPTRPNTATGFPAGSPVGDPLRGPQWAPLPVPGPAPLQNPQQFWPDGTPALLPQSPPKVTDPTAHVINGVEITAPDVRPDLISIATEVGRIERKTAGLLQGGDLGPSLADLLGQLQALLQGQQDQTDYLQQPIPPTTWEVTAPCNRDGNGDPVTLTYQIPGGDSRDVQLARLSALMNAYATSWQWRRPLCKGQAVTNNVTITAYAIDPP